MAVLDKFPEMVTTAATASQPAPAKLLPSCCGGPAGDAHSGLQQLRLQRHRHMLLWQQREAVGPRRKAVASSSTSSPGAVRAGGCSGCSGRAAASAAGRSGSETVGRQADLGGGGMGCARLGGARGRGAARGEGGSSTGMARGTAAAAGVPDPGMAAAGVPDQGVAVAGMPDTGVAVAGVRCPCQPDRVLAMLEQLYHDIGKVNDLVGGVGLCVCVVGWRGGGDTWAVGLGRRV